MSNESHGNAQDADRCGSCKFFKRWEWHEAYGGGKQGGGSCQHLLSVLQLTNAKMWAIADLHVQESFGCSLHREAK
jgi:hypothetical protein